MKTYQVLYRIFKENKFFSKVNSIALQAVATDAKSDEWNVVADEARPRLKEVLDSASKKASFKNDTYTIPFDNIGNRADKAAIQEAIKDTEDNPSKIVFSPEGPMLEPRVEPPEDTTLASTDAIVNSAKRKPRKKKK